MMKIVILRKIDPDISSYFICLLLSKVKKNFSDEKLKDCIYIMDKKGEIKLTLSKEEYKKLKNFIKKYEHMIKVYDISPKENNELSKQNIKEEVKNYDEILEVWNMSLKFLKANPSLAFSWSGIEFLLMISSLFPVLGIIILFFNQVFIFSFNIFLTFLFLRERINLENVETISRKINLRNTFSDKMLVSGLGFVLGQTVLLLLFTIVLFIIGYITGTIGVLYDISIYGRIRYSIFNVSLALILFSLTFLTWYIYALPLIIAKSSLNPSFENAFKALISVIIPPFIVIKESFSSDYLKIGGLWLVVSTVGFMSIIFLALLLITLPVAFIISYWLNIYLSVSAYIYAKKKYN